MPGILVFGEMNQGELASVTGELIGVARALSADTGDDVVVTLQSDSVGERWGRGNSLWSGQGVSCGERSAL